MTIPVMGTPMEMSFNVVGTVLGYLNFMKTFEEIKLIAF
jgi:hypothetical protein